MATDRLREIAEQINSGALDIEDCSYFLNGPVGKLERAIRVRDQAWNLIITCGVTEEELNEVTAELLKAEAKK